MFFFSSLMFKLFQSPADTLFFYALGSLILQPDFLSLIFFSFIVYVESSLLLYTFFISFATTNLHISCHLNKP